jgi:hypothetical protein
MKVSKQRFLPDRRRAQRHHVQTALRIRLWKSKLPEQRAESIDLSERGTFFVTDMPLHEGEAIEVLLKMPKEITGEPTTEWLCTGLVVRVQPVDSPNGKIGVGVRFDCYEVSRCSPVAELEPSAPYAR